jgi:hypothetical protein
MPRGRPRKKTDEEAAPAEPQDRADMRGRRRLGGKWVPKRTGLGSVAIKAMQVGWCELAILRYYSSLHPQSTTSSILRQALWALMRSDPDIDPQQFRDFVHASVLPEIDDETHRRFLLKAVDDFVAPQPLQLRGKIDSSELVSRNF